MVDRPNQKSLKPADWAAFIDAVNKTHGVPAKPPAYRSFVDVHVRSMSHTDPEGMTWGVHTMGATMRGRNFVAWHRQFVLQMEKRLQLENPQVAIPYWDAATDRALPAALTDPKLLEAWGITRNWNPSRLPTVGDLNTIKKLKQFVTFQATIEGAVHAGIHNAVGGHMASSSSPADPVFWLHHANIDRLWAEWQAANPGENPPNADETLQPKPLFGVKVPSILNIATLGYRYV